MDRRSFIRFVGAGSAAGLIAPKLVLATPAGNLMQSKMAGGLYHTQMAPGRWNGKVESHYPHMTKKIGEDGKMYIRVLTQHGFQGYEHYIIKHMLLDQNFQFIAENYFDPKKDKVPLSVFAIPNTTGPVFALSVCNKHDTWMNVLEV